MTPATGSTNSLVFLGSGKPDARKADNRTTLRKLILLQFLIPSPSMLQNSKKSLHGSASMKPARISKLIILLSTVQIVLTYSFMTAILVTFVSLGFVGSPLLLLMENFVFKNCFYDPFRIRKKHLLSIAC